MSGNVATHHHRLRSRERKHVERITRRELTLLGYDVGQPTREWNVRAMVKAADRALVVFGRLVRGARMSPRELSHRIQRIRSRQKMEEERASELAPIARPRHVGDELNRRR
jgi:hypothetical protein